jgi:hypothetical protein
MMMAWKLRNRRSKDSIGMMEPTVEAGGQNIFDRVNVGVADSALKSSQDCRALEIVSALEHMVTGSLVRFCSMDRVAKWEL